jgi:hypothetical protein
LHGKSNFDAWRGKSTVAGTGWITYHNKVIIIIIVLTEHISHDIIFPYSYIIFRTGRSRLPGKDFVMGTNNKANKWTTPQDSGVRYHHIEIGGGF